MKISCPSCGASFNVKPEALGASGRKVKCGKCAHQWHALPDGASATPPEAEAAPVPPPVESPVPESPPVQTPSQAATDYAAEMATEPQFEPTLPEPETDAEAAAPPPADPDTADPDTAPDFDAEPFPKLDIPAPETDIADAAPPIPEPIPPSIKESNREPNQEKPKPGLGRRLGRGALVSAGAAAAAVIILVGGAIFLQPQITRMVPAAASLYARMGLHSDVPGLGLTIVEPKIEGDEGVLQIVGVIRNETKEPLDVPVMQARLLDEGGEPINVWLFRAAKPKIAAGETIEYKTEFRDPPPKAKRLDITFTSKQNTPADAPELARKPAPDMTKSSDAKAPAKPEK